MSGKPARARRDRESVKLLGYRIDDAVKIAEQYGQIHGDHHRAWVIDQMVRALLDTSYQQWRARMDADGYDEGIAP